MDAPGLRTSAVGRSRLRARGSGLAGACLFAAGCSGSAFNSAPAEDPGGAPAVARSEDDRPSPTCEVGRAPLILGQGSQAYVEPENLFRVGTEWIVAGTPTYTWHADGVGPAERSSAYRHIAASFTPDGMARMIEKPIVGAIGSVRATPLGENRWAVLFDEVHPDSLPGKFHSLGLWYAERIDDRWSTVERLPLPEQGTPDFSSSSALVRAGDALTWVVAVRRPTRPGPLVRYERRNGQWRHEVIPHEGVEVTALAYAADSGLWLAQFSEGPDIGGPGRSLRLYRRDAGWELVRRVGVVAPEATIFDPGILAGPRGVSLTWREVGRGERSARTILGIGPDGGGRRALLDPSAIQVVPLGLRNGDPAWLTVHAAAGTAPELRLVRARSFPGAETVAMAPSPYRGFLAAAPSSSTEVLVVGPQVGLDPKQPAVRSLLLRLSTSCT